MNRYSFLKHLLLCSMLARDLFVFKLQIFRQNWNLDLTLASLFHSSNTESSSWPS